MEAGRQVTYAGRLISGYRTCGWRAGRSVRFYVYRLVDRKFGKWVDEKVER